MTQRDESGSATNRWKEFNDEELRHIFGGFLDTCQGTSPEGSLAPLEDELRQELQRRGAW